MTIKEIATNVKVDPMMVRTAAKDCGFVLKRGRKGNDFNTKDVAKIERMLGSVAKEASTPKKENVKAPAAKTTAKAKAEPKANKSAKSKTETKPRPSRAKAKAPAVSPPPAPIDDDDEEEEEN